MGYIDSKFICDSCNVQHEYNDLHTVNVNESFLGPFGPRRNPHGSYYFCDDCLGVTKKLKEVRQVTDPPKQKPLGMFAKIKEFFSEKQSGQK